MKHICKKGTFLIRVRIYMLEAVRRRVGFVMSPSPFPVTAGYLGIYQPLHVVYRHHFLFSYSFDKMM